MNTPVRVVLASKGRVVHTINPEAPVVDAVRRMARLGVGSMVVTQGPAVVGLLTDRHVITGLAKGGLPIHRVAVADYMDAGPPTIDPDAPVGWAMTLMTERFTRHLPVIEGGVLAGIVSQGDLTRWVTRTLTFEVDSLQKYIVGAYT